MNYIDIETVSFYKNLAIADQRTKDCWAAKMKGELPGKIKQLADETDDSVENVDDAEALFELYRDKAALYSEFNKIVCVSLGTVLSSGAIYIKSSSGDDEIEILKDVAKALDGKYELCAHNGLNFDFPILCRKYLIHGLPIPSVLNGTREKPWNSPFFDTQQYWKFGDLRYTVSLDQLAMVFNLPSPKANMHGSEVSEYYWSGRLKEIVNYCEQDVKALINVHRKMTNLPIITELHSGEPQKQEELFK